MIFCNIYERIKCPCIQFHITYMFGCNESQWHAITIYNSFFEKSIRQYNYISFPPFCLSFSTN